MVGYEEGKLLKEILNTEARKWYKPKHPHKKMIEFLEENECKFERVHPQSQHKEALQMFCVATQFVYGNCAAELIDKAIDTISGKGGK